MIDTKKIAAEYRLVHWAGVRKERTESGLSVKAFCETAGYHPNSYFYWQRKLRESACEGISPTDTLSTPSEWALAVASGTERGDTSRTVPVEIGKCRVLADIDTDERLLSRICRILSALC
jgi:putative transposase